MTKLPTVSTRNVLRVFRSASIDDLMEGGAWYQRANDLAGELDSFDVPRAAAVIAVLSPRLSWARNVELATVAYEASRARCSVQDIADQLTCLRGNAIKAGKILRGADPDQVVKGPKVRAFWRAIIDPTASDAIVIDRHAIDVAVGRVLDDRTRGVLLGTPGRYAAVSDCYRRAAAILSRELGRPIVPSEVQATTWVAWRRTRAVGTGGKRVTGVTGRRRAIKTVTREVTGVTGVTPSGGAA